MGADLNKRKEKNMDNTFEVTREGSCIWVKDLRVPPEEGTSEAGVKHLIPEQAQELIDKLQAVLKSKP